MKSTSIIAIISLYILIAKAKPETRIIGGSDASAGQFPFAAAIDVQTNTSKFFCGGSILSRQWILTSGHCVNNAQLFKIQLGSNTLTNSDPYRQTFITSEYILHPDFNPYKIFNDVGLIKLNIPVIYNDYLQPIRLPPVTLLNNSEVTLIGWGQTSDYNGDLSETLQYVKGTILSNAECKIIYGSQIAEHMACVVGNYHEGTCTGDTGSPMIEYVFTTSWIVGLASFISGNGCENSDPSGFTRIFPYLDWIQNTIAE